VELPLINIKNSTDADRIPVLKCAGLFLLLLLVFILDVMVGSRIITFPELFRALAGKGDEYISSLLLTFRLPRALTAVFAGVALSVSGLQMQTVFRNPLAGPYVLGISSGASLGVALLILGFSSFFTVAGLTIGGNWAIVVAAWLGSGIVLLLILVVSGRVRDIMTVLILGIMLGGAIAAIVSILQYFSSESMLKAFVIWTMGSLGNLTWNQLNVLIISIITGLVFSLISIKPLNAMLLGEEYARTMGLNIQGTRTLVFISTSILAGSVTAFCGPIAFIGIAVPHITRLLLNRSSHNFLFPGSVIVGGILLLLSDIISQLPGSDKVLPINSITALIGIPVMIWIILRRNRLISIN
jgi:iron complex transport system permease protein